MRAIAAALVMACALAVSVQAQELSGSGLVNALRRGGYVLVMRHASSPRETPDAKTANPDNTSRERQLDETGRTTATAMGAALKQLAIPIGQVFTSPTYRARETVRLLSLKDAMPIEELGDAGRSMQAAGDAQAEWLQKTVARAPSTSAEAAADKSTAAKATADKMGNTLVITHQPNIARAFPNLSDVADGETLVFRPDGKGGTMLAARVKIEEWARLR
jgi:phosphohistidine phosphatase SixA